MQLLETTRQHQSNLALYCRSGKLTEIPGINKDNIIQYRRLVYNVVDDMLQNAYPLTYQTLTVKEWNNVVKDFFTNHPCQSPQVWYMPKEFYEYLVETKHPLLKTYLFLKELLEFEWMEVELFMMEDKPVIVNETGDILLNKMLLNPEHKLMHFNYPVHLKNPLDIRESQKGNYFVVAHRNQEGEVIFTECNPGLIRMLEYLQENPLSIKDLIKNLKKEYALPLTVEDHQKLVLFFREAYQQNLIAGFEN